MMATWTTVAAAAAIAAAEGTNTSAGSTGSTMQELAAARAERPRQDRAPGEKTDLVVMAAPGSYASFPQIVRTDRELVLEFPVQNMDALKASGQHPHYQPVATTHWAVSTDGGLTWSVGTNAPTIGRVLDAVRENVPRSDGSLLTVTYAKQPAPEVRRGHLGGNADEQFAPVDWGEFGRAWPFDLVRAPDGGLLLAGYAAPEGEKRETCAFARSEDEGRTWQYVSRMPNPEVYDLQEPSLLALPDGRILCMIRVGWERVPYEKWHPDARYRFETTPDRLIGAGWYFVQSESADGGRSWATPRVTRVWGHPAHLLRLRSGRVLMVYGHRQPPWSIRAVVSEDDGRSWNIEGIRTIMECDPGERDFGYPVATQMEDGSIVTAYYGYSTLDVALPSPHGVFVSIFDEEWLLKTGRP